MLARQEALLADALEAAIRGPRRNGLFAVWLLIRAAGDLLSPSCLNPRGHLQRVDNLGLRLNALSLAAPLRRAITAVLSQLRQGSAQAARTALHQLTAPAREILGATAADAVDRAAEIAREVCRERKP